LPDTSTPGYDEHYFTSRESWPDFRLEMETILRLTRPAATGRVLELGCGSGALLQRLAPVARLAVGMDISPTGLELASGRARRKPHDRSGIGLLCARAERLPFRDGSFDAVVSQHLVEHLDAPSAALIEWHRVLRPGGILALVTPNGEYPDPDIFADPTHMILFTRDSLRAYLKASGFRVCRAFTLFPYLGRGRVARSASIRLAGVARHIPGLSLSGRSLVISATRM
jgi:SAM-dependent methyltransferase